MAPENAHISKGLVEAVADHINGRYGTRVERELRRLIQIAVEKFEKHNRILRTWNTRQVKRLRKELMDDVLENQSNT
ncbi:MAG: hypothetical protein LN417_06110 [Candidatus Thermoplasmatota archaeon]|nr:hypothetical protein [Candidatus Thermoplasmatota archaeon]